MARETLFNEQLQFAYNPVYGAYGSGIAPSPFVLIAGETYTVSWNGEEYTRTAFAADTFSPGAVGLGNAAFIGGTPDPDGLSFIIGYLPAENQVAILTTSTDASHTIGIYQGEAESEAAVYYSVSSLSLKAIGNAIREKNGTTAPLGFPEEMVEAINGITTGGGGDMPADVHRVTFMDGDSVLFVRSVADGDDCADVVNRNLIEAPTKESTVQYNYKHSGWSLTDGGSADSTALSSVTEDRTVYAAFNPELRSYTITYYDADGVTVLKTEQAAYGSTLNAYTPAKSGHSFNGWIPEVAEVTGDASYTASWIEKIVFATGAWSDIARISESGEAANHFKLGDTRVINVNGVDITFYIAGFGQDDLADGSGTAGMTLLAKDTTGEIVHTTKDKNVVYSGCEVDTKVNSYLSTLESDLQSVIKNVAKKVNTSTGSTSTIGTINRKLWVPSCYEVCISPNFAAGVYISSLGNQYKHIADKASYNRSGLFPTSSKWWMPRDNHAGNYSYTRHYYVPGYGNPNWGSNDTEYQVLLGFCI